MIRIALAVIADDHAFEDGIERMLASVAGQVTGVFINFTGKNTEVANLIAEAIDPDVFPEGNVITRQWYEDFSFARNQSFAMIRKHERAHNFKFDWIIWLDCDDVLDFDIEKAIEICEERRAHSALITYHYKYDIERQRPMMSHLKERLFRADQEWRWIYPIHENCVGPMGARTTTLDSSFAVIHMRGQEEGKRDRNKDLIKLWYSQTEGKEPRAILFMAHQTYALAEEAERAADREMLYKGAIKLYQDFMKTNPGPEDWYTCNRQVAEILRTMGRYSESISIDLQGLKMNPALVGSYVGLAQTSYEAGEYDDAITWADLAVEVAKRSVDSQVVDALELDYKPLMIKAAALRKKGDLYEALKAYSDAIDIYDDDFTERQIAEIKKKINGQSCRSKKPDNRKLHWGDKPEKSIAFFVPPSIENWNFSLLIKNGLGGTETSVIKLAWQFALDGWRVAIFGSPGDWDGRVQDVEGGGTVEWYSSSAFHPDEPFTVFVGLRSPEIMDMQIKAQKKILWLHDLNVGPTRFGDFGDRFSKCDAIVCPSEFHVEHIKRVYDYASDPWMADTIAIGNGFDHHVFQKFANAPRDPYTVVYASSPDRGLTRLLDLWPEISKREPKAKLKIYYGWDSIDAIIARGLPTAPMLQHFKDTTVAKLDSLIMAGENIRWVGRIDQSTLAEEFHRAGVIAYPANFMETFGIVFVQAMSAGVVPVVSSMGSLPDLVPDNWPATALVEGPPDSMEFGGRFVDAVVNAMSRAHNDERAMLSTFVQHFNWPLIYTSWQKLVTVEVAA